MYSSVLVRQSYREGDKVKHRTLANLSKLPPAAVDAVRAVLRGEPVGPLEQAFEIERSLLHGHVWAVLSCGCWAWTSCWRPGRGGSGIWRWP